MNPYEPMFLPESIAEIINALETAGFSAYAVGGCVRDACLGLDPHDYDLCTSALPEQTEAVFRDRRLVLAGKKHGTIGVVTATGVVEITTFRTEGSYRDNRHPDWVQFVPDVESDLARRDFTVNAMAYSPTRGYADPFGGREDLRKGILRAVGDPEKRFQEDALRILRGVRFAVRFGLKVDAATEQAMFSQAARMDSLARERVFEELCKLLPLVTAEDLQHFAPILAAVIPELKPMIGFDQRSPHHAYDLYTHVAHVVAGVPADLALRWAALLHDVGKVPTFTLDETGRGHFYNHAAKGAEMAEEILRRLKAPNALREQVVLLIDKHMLWLVPEKKQLRRQIGRLGMGTVYQILSLQQADNSNKGTEKSGDNEKYLQILDVLEEIRSEDGCLSLKDLAVNGNDLVQIGFSGRTIGLMLNWLLEQVMEETLPNERSVLLAWAQQVWTDAWQGS